MDHQLTTVLNPVTCFDDCLITRCLKKLFVAKEKTVADTTYIISNHAADIKNTVELLNKNVVTELSYNYLVALEKSLPAVSFQYLVIYKQNKPVLFAYYQLLTLTAENFKPEKNSGVAKRIMRFLLGLKSAKVLFSGNTLRNETPFCCFDHKVLKQEQANELVVSMAEKIAADTCATALILKDIPFDGKQKKWISTLGFQTPIEDQEMVLAMDKAWNSMDDYTHALSRKYKTRAKKIIESAAALQISVLDDAALLQNSAQINQLFRQVSANQAFTLTQASENHFGLMKQVYKDQFEVVGFYLDDQLIAFYSAFINTDGYELYYCGFEYELNNKYNLYFNILYSGLGQAMHHKKGLLKLGRTSFDAKASLGAKPQSLPYYFKAGNMPGLVVEWLVWYFETLEDGRWKQRAPLKSA